MKLNYKMVNNIAFQRKLRKLKKPLSFSHILPTMRIMCNRQFSINKEVEADKPYSLRLTSLTRCSRHFEQFFFYLGFLSRTPAIHRTSGKGEAFSLALLYHFHPLHRNLDVNRAIDAEGSPLHTANSPTRIGNLELLSTSWRIKIALNLKECDVVLLSFNFIQKYLRLL